MRKFRFVGNPKFYNSFYQFENGTIYNSDYKTQNGFYDVLQLSSDNPHYWQEVFDNPIQELNGSLDKMHKDTDLGYFSLEIMKSFISIAPYMKNNENPSNVLFVKDCISLAKELVKQLDEE